MSFEQVIRRELERKRRSELDAMQHSAWMQLDHDRARLWAGLPPQLTPVALYGGGITPFSLPHADQLQSWHASSRGLQLASSLVPNIGTDPSVNFDADVNANVAFRCDITLGGVLPGIIAQYALTLDGGLSFFQSGTIATFVSVPLLGRTLIFNNGTYTTGNQYIGVAKSVTNQTPKLRTLLGAPTDSSKPRVVPNFRNGYPGLTGVAGTSGALLCTSTTGGDVWASDVASGTNRSMAYFWVGATGSATPASVQGLWSFGGTGALNPNAVIYLATRNGTNLYRCGRINDANASSVRDAGAISTAPHLWTFLLDSNTVTLRLDGTVIVNALSLGSGATSLDAVSFFCLYQNGGQINTNLATFLEGCSYSTGVWTAGELTEAEQYYRGKYSL